MEKRIMKTSETKLPETAPESFEQLCGILLPRPVHDETENREMIRVMDWIAVRAHNQDQFDYAKMLGNLVTEYEVSQKRRTKPQLAGLELLKAVTESSGMTQAELAKLLDIEQGTVSKIMSGARSITLDHAKRVARRFKMRPEAFLDLD
jgi:HTH-type transcriptional regulator / antitoxin HigA